MYLPMTIPSRLETTATTWSGMPFAPPAKRTTAQPARKPMPQAAMPISYSLRITIRPQRKPPTTAATRPPAIPGPPVLEHRRNRLLVGPGAHLLRNERDVVVGRLTRLLRLARLARIVPLHRDPLSHACVTRHLRRPACLSAMARLRVPGIPYGTGAVFESACVVGAGRVGKAMVARLGERIPTQVAGRDLECGDAELVLLCVPDRAIPEVAVGIRPGPWVAHTSGACRLEALAPHDRRFSLHPLQTFTLDRGPEQLDGAWAAVSGESADALLAGAELARRLGLKPFELDDEMRPLYHAAASFV